jgi:hypothetical protein
MQEDELYAHMLAGRRTAVAAAKQATKAPTAFNLTTQETKMRDAQTMQRLFMRSRFRGIFLTVHCKCPSFYHDHSDEVPPDSIGVASLKEVCYQLITARGLRNMSEEERHAEVGYLTDAVSGRVVLLLPVSPSGKQGHRCLVLQRAETTEEAVLQLLLVLCVPRGELQSVICAATSHVNGRECAAPTLSSRPHAPKSVNHNSADLRSKQIAGSAHCQSESDNSSASGYHSSDLEFTSVWSSSYESLEEEEQHCVQPDKEYAARQANKLQVWAADGSLAAMEKPK